MFYFDENFNKIKGKKGSWVFINNVNIFLNTFCSIYMFEWVLTDTYIQFASYILPDWLIDTAAEPEYTLSWTGKVFGTHRRCMPFLVAEKEIIRWNTHRKNDRFMYALLEFQRLHDHNKTYSFVWSTLSGLGLWLTLTVYFDCA